jgi:hypothetical protein
VDSKKCYRIRSSHDSSLLAGEKRRIKTFTLHITLTPFEYSPVTTGRKLDRPEKWSRRDREKKSKNKRNGKKRKKSFCPVPETKHRFPDYNRLLFLVKLLLFCMDAKLGL